jgi:predicted enzyme related to lactoylglutathione lyase
MTLRLWSIEVDAHDPATLGHWWADVLGWKIFFESDDEVVVTTPDERFPGLVFSKVPEGKSVKNRLHLDFAPDDRDAEVGRLTRLGARRVDIGQTGDETWVVLADPEGNEFCVLGARDGGM